MSTAPALAEKGASAVPILETGRAAPILEEAARLEAPIRLVTRCATEPLELRGRVVRAEADALGTVLADAGIHVGKILCARDYDATLDLEHGRYCFATRILSIIRERDEWSARLERPDAVRAIQRRRFWRARLEGSSTVRVQPLNGAEPRACEGKILNISPDGMACLLACRDADRLGLAAPVRVRFGLPDVAEPFAIEGRVRAQTPGSDARTVVCGIQFIGTRHASGGLSPDQDDRRRLAEILHERGQ